jgi:hypothetical protein
MIIPPQMRPSESIDRFQSLRRFYPPHLDPFDDRDIAFVIKASTMWSDKFFGLNGSLSSVQVVPNRSPNPLADAR